MKYSYDYSDLLSELQEEVDEGILSDDSEVQILRKDETIFKDYKPIIDWFYNDTLMEEMLIPDIFDDKEDLEDKARLKELYTVNQPKLQSVKLIDLIEELEKVNSIC